MKCSVVYLSKTLLNSILAMECILSTSYYMYFECTLGIIAVLHDSFQATVDFGVSSVSKFLDAILKSLALQASTYYRKHRMQYLIDNII